MNVFVTKFVTFIFLAVVWVLQLNEIVEEVQHG